MRFRLILTATTKIWDFIESKTWHALTYAGVCGWERFFTLHQHGWSFGGKLKQVLNPPNIRLTSDSSAPINNGTPDRQCFPWVNVIFCLKFLIKRIINNNAVPFTLQLCCFADQVWGLIPCWLYKGNLYMKYWYKLYSFLIGKVLLCHWSR